MFVWNGIKGQSASALIVNTEPAAGEMILRGGAIGFS